MHRLVAVRDPFVGAVDGERVLNEIVGANREEVHLAREERGGEGRRGHLDHDPDRHGRRLDTAIPELAPRLVDDRAGRSNLLHRGHKGKQDSQRTVYRGAQQRPHLPLEHLGFCEAEADAAQARRFAARRHRRSGLSPAGRPSLPPAPGRLSTGRPRPRGPAGRRQA